MNLLKTLWDKLVNKTSASPTLVAVEEESCTDIFKQICLDAGIRNKDLASGKVLESFEAWYDGPCNEDSIRTSIADFKAAHSAAAAKMMGKL